MRTAVSEEATTRHGSEMMNSCSVSEGRRIARISFFENLPSALISIKSGARRTSSALVFFSLHARSLAFSWARRTVANGEGVPVNVIPKDPSLDEKRYARKRERSFRNRIFFNNRQ